MVGPVKVGLSVGSAERNSGVGSETKKFSDGSAGIIVEVGSAESRIVVPRKAIVESIVLVLFPR